MRDEHVELEKRAGVDERYDPLAGGTLAARMLTLVCVFTGRCRGGRAHPFEARIRFVVHLATAVLGRFHECLAHLAPDAKRFTDLPEHEARLVPRSPAQGRGGCEPAVRSAVDPSEAYRLGKLMDRAARAGDRMDAYGRAGEAVANGADQRGGYVGAQHVTRRRARVELGEIIRSVIGPNPTDVAEAVETRERAQAVEDAGHARGIDQTPARGRPERR